MDQKKERSSMLALSFLWDVLMFDLCNPIRRIQQYHLFTAAKILLLISHKSRNCLLSFCFYIHSIAMISLLLPRKNLLILTAILAKQAIKSVIINHSQCNLRDLQFVYNRIMSQDFCYWDAKSKKDVIVIIINQSIVTTILVTAILRMPYFYHISKRNSQIDIKRIAVIHSLIIAWGIFQSVVNFYSIVNYLNLEKKIKSEDMIDYSHTFAFICSFPGFLVQTMFITICYTFCRNIIRNVNMRNFPVYSFKFVKLLKFYFFIRVIVRIIIIILILAFPAEQVSTFSTIEFISLIIDSAIIIIFIILSIIFFMSKLQNHYYKSLKSQYKKMLACSICRIVIDSLYLVLNSLSDEEQRWCVSQQPNNWIYTVFYNILGNFLMHFVPITFIMRIYRFDHREFQQQSMAAERDMLNKSGNLLNQTQFVQE